MSASTKDLLALSESILSETKPAKTVVPVGADPIVDDGLKDVVVPDTFISDIINFSDRLNESEDSASEEEAVQSLSEAVQPVVEATLTEEKVLSLVERLKSLILEAREVMTEMTTSGMIGAGVQSNLLKKKRKKKR